MANRDIEGPILRSIISYLRTVLPGNPLIHHCANEFGLKGKDVARQIAKNKHNGMLPGFPDILVLPFASVGPMLFEVKAPGGKPTPAQDAVHVDMTRLGYRVAVVRSIDDVRAKLDEWGVWRSDAGRAVQS